MHQAEAYRLSHLLSADRQVVFSKNFEQLVHDLRYPEEYALPDISVQATLRDYQQLGVRWL
ncbi:hypothetical protein ABXW34_24965, partial [Streptococcus suis]